MTLEEYKDEVLDLVEELVEKAGLMGLANILKSMTVNMELSEEDQKSVDELYQEIMAEERIVEQDVEEN